MQARAVLLALAASLAVPAAAQTELPALPPAAQAEAPESPVVESLSRADRLAIQRVIVEQIKALQREEDLAAFQLAAPDIRRQFGSAQAFVTMVKLGYEPIFHNRSAMFVETAVVEGTVVQAMRIVQSDGDVVQASFSMERQANGEWRVSGCEIEPTDLIAT